MKRAFALLLAICLLFALAAPAAALTPAFEEYLSCSLKCLGLFEGVSDTSFALNRAPSRTEALIMLIRLLGREEEALACTAPIPFTDVEDWAVPYVAYGYVNGLSDGVDETLFGTGEANCAMYLTFVLRALGYKDGEEGDFLWDDPYTLARDVGILPEGVDTVDFMRSDVVRVSYAALGAFIKDTKTTLNERLIASGAYTAEDAEKYYDDNAMERGAVSLKLSTLLDETMAAARSARLNEGLEIDGQYVHFFSTCIQIGNAGYEQYGAYKGGAERCAAQVSKAANALADKARVFYLIAPNSLGGMLSADSYGRVCSSSQREGIAYSYECADDNVICVDAWSALRAHNDEYIYYRTDHHWTALGAYYGYAAFAEAAGFEAKDLSDFEKSDKGSYTGSFYSWCSYPALFKQQPDTVYAYSPKGDITVAVNDGGGDYAGRLICDYSSYSAFLGGDHNLTTITNNDIKDDSACLVIKDSYGNAFSVYLAEHYHTVYVADCRTYKNLAYHLNVSGFAEELGVDDVIFLLSVTFSQSDGVASLLSQLT